MASLLALLGSLIFTPIAASASDDWCLELDDGLTGVVAESFDNYVCQVTFTETQGAPWTLPSDATKLSIVGVGGGGGTLRNTNNSYTYAGGGGQLNYVDTVNLVNRDFTVTIGAAGDKVESKTASAAENGGNTTVVNGASTTILTAAGGFGGIKTTPANSAYKFARDGLVGTVIFKNNDYPNPDGLDWRGGAGTGAASTAKEVAGLGQAISSEIQADAGSIDYLDTTLWGEDSEVLGSGISLKTFEFGSGGAVTTSPSDKLSGSGGGSSTNKSGTTISLAGSGIVIMRFVIPAPIVTVTFDANGGSGTMASQDASTATPLTATSFTRSEFTFAGWNTQANGGGTAYADGATFPFSVNTSLFAQWTAVVQAVSAPAAPSPYSGPLISGFSLTQLTSGNVEEITVTGRRLNIVSAASIDGVALEILSISSQEIRFRIPGLTPGTKNLLLISTEGRLTQQNAFVVRDAIIGTQQADAKVNAGSFKGKVAVYAKGYEGKRLSVKIGNDWVIVNSLASNFERVTYFTGAGASIAVRIYIDRVLVDTINLVTK